jgi:hypothetical protein
MEVSNVAAKDPQSPARRGTGGFDETFERRPAETDPVVQLFVFRDRVSDRRVRLVYFAPPVIRS